MAGAKRSVDDMNRIIILDTTLRDGEQAPGMAMTPEEKLAVALMLEKCGVDIIEAGFPVSSQRDFEAVKAIAETVKNCAVSALARVVENDIDRAAEALKDAVKRHIHLSIATSPIHRDKKLRMSRDEVLKKAVNAVRYALTKCDTVEIGAEDATRTEPEFLLDFFTAVTEAGARVINIADTSGYSLPQEFAKLTSFIAGGVPKVISGDAIVSVHCHNDLGLALANTIAGISAGALQVEATLMGVGERAGNAALEELAAVMKTRGSALGKYETAVNTQMLIPACELVSSIEAISPGASKPLTGRNAFAHSSGIHQDGMLKCRQSYEIIDPADFGGAGFRILLSRHSGRSGVASKVGELLGYEPPPEAMDAVMRGFEKIASSEKSVSCTALLRILRDCGLYDGVIYSILKISVLPEKIGKNYRYCARVDLKVNETKCPVISAEDDDAFKALFSVLGSAMPWGIKIKNFSLSLFGAGERLSASAILQAETGGALIRAESNKHDIYAAAAGAYIDAANYAAAAFKLHAHEMSHAGMAGA